MNIKREIERFVRHHIANRNFHRINQVTSNILERILFYQRYHPQLQQRNGGKSKVIREKLSMLLIF